MNNFLEKYFIILLTLQEETLKFSDWNWNWWSPIYLCIALPSDGGLSWYALSSYDYLITFAATPRILFTKLLADMFQKFYEITINPQQNSSSNDSSGGSAPEAPVKCKYGILMEKTSAIAIQFLYNKLGLVKMKKTILLSH